MSDFLLTTLDPWARPMLGLIFESLIYGTAITLMLTVLLKVFPGSTARGRALVWVMALASILAVTALCAWRVLPSAPPASGAGAPVKKPPAAVLTPLEGSEPAPTTPSPWRSKLASVRQESLAAQPAVREAILLHLPAPAPVLALIALLTGSAFLLFRLGRGYLYLSWLKRRSRPARGTTRARLERWRGLLGEQRKIDLATSPEAPLPVFAGLGQPTILLPEGIEDALSDDEVDYILIHELAHCERRDDWINLFQSLVEALFYFHPAVWWSSRRLRLERELSCDDRVVSLTGSPRPYAACLTRLARLRLSQPTVLTPLGVGLGTNDFSWRIETLLNLKHQSAHSSGVVKAGIAAALALTSLPLVLGLPVLTFPAPTAIAAPAATETRATHGLDEIRTLRPDQQVARSVAIATNFLSEVESRQEYFSMLTSTLNDAQLAETLDQLLRGSWLSRDARLDLLAAAEAGFSSEASLVDFVSEHAEFFLGEPELRQALASLTSRLGSEEARQRLGAAAPDLESSPGGENRPPRSRTVPAGYRVIETPESGTQLNARREQVIVVPGHADAPAAPSPADLALSHDNLSAAEAEKRAAAAYHLGRMRERASGAIPALIELLADETRVNRAGGLVSIWWGGKNEHRATTSPAEEAAKALLYIGKAATDPLREAAQREGWEGQDRASWALELLGRFD